MSDKRDYVKEWLLEQYAKKPVRMFVQLDGTPYEWYGPNAVVELRQTDFPVRLQISMGATKEEVLATLKDMYLRLHNEWLDFEEMEHRCRDHVQRHVNEHRGDQLLKQFVDGLSGDDKEAVEWVLWGRDNDIPF